MAFFSKMSSIFITKYHVFIYTINKVLPKTTEMPNLSQCGVAE